MIAQLWYMLTMSFRPHENGTVRYAFPLVILATVFAGMTAALVGGEASYIKITSKPAQVQAGETFTVTVEAVAHVAVNAVDISISFPKQQMEVVGIDVGESVITLWAEQPYTKNGVVYLRGGLFKKGFIGTHVIARIKARAVDSGLARVSTEDARFVAGDGSGVDVQLSDSPLNETKIYILNKDGTAVGAASINIVTDVDGSGSVDIRDISAFMAAWFNKVKIFDFNGDGKMNLRDFSILLAESFFK